MTEIKPATKAAVSVVLFLVLLDAISFSIVMPVMPVLITELTGGTLSEAATIGGWLLVVFAITQFFFAPILGGLSDKFGRRPVLLASLGLFGVDYLIMGISPTLGFLFLGRILSGIPGASFAAANSYMADISNDSNRAKNFALIGAGFSGGFIVGPAIGGLLGTFGSRAPFLAASAVSFISFSVGFFVLKESLSKENRRPFDWKRANPVGSLIQLRKFPQVFGLAMALFLFWVAIQAYPTTWSFYTIYKFGWTTAFVGLSLTAYGAVIAFSQAKMADVVIPRLGESRTVRYGLLLAAVGFAGQSVATEGWMIFVWVPVWLVGALVMPTINAMMSKQVPMDAQGELQGAQASLFSLSSIIGPLVMAQLFGIFSAPGAPLFFPGMGFLVGALLSLGAIVLVQLALRHATLTPQTAEMPIPSAPADAARP